MLAIYKKELRSYFTNAIGYVYVGVFLAVSAAICSYTTLQQKTYDTRYYFTFMMYALVVLIPLLTMRLFSEEKKTKTEQLLLTAPITITEMVLGKYLAAFTLYVGTVIASCLNFFPLYVLAGAQKKAAEASGDSASTIELMGVNGAQIFGSIIGMILIGAAIIAVGMFISSLTENQLSAAVISISAVASMVVIHFLLSAGNDSAGTRIIGSYVIRTVLGWISIFSRFTNFGYGIFDFSALLYYVSFAFVFIYLTARVYEKRRWS